MRTLSKHFAELWLSYASDVIKCRRYQRMPHAFH
jgi:hypothetical protein